MDKCLEESFRMRKTYRFLSGINIGWQSGMELEGANGQKGGGPILTFCDTFFASEGAEKWELLENFWEKWG